MTRYMGYIGEDPEDTARTIINAVKKNKFLVVTAPFSRADYFVRRHFASIVT